MKVILVALAMLCVTHTAFAQRGDRESHRAGSGDHDRRDWRHDRYDRQHADHQRWRHSQPRFEPSVGGFIGGVIGGIISSQLEPFDPIADCVRRYRSYDARTGYYMGYDGYPRRCP